MTEEENKHNQLHQKLLDDAGFTISKEECMELFVTENMVRKDGEPSVSYAKLMTHGFKHGIVKKLQTDAQQGLDAQGSDISLRKKIYGKNARHKRKTRTVCDMICEVFEDFILKVLIVAAIVSTTLGIMQHGWAAGFQEGAGIMFAIVIIVLVTVVNDYTKEKKFQELMNQADTKTVKCLRSGSLCTLDSEELVVGDIIKIGYGDAVPADLLVILDAECFADESSLTGEPDEVQKEVVSEEHFKGDPFMLQGSQIQKGEATCIVLAVGDNTNQGQAGLSMNIEADETPLQKKLNGIAEGIGKLGLTVAILTLIAIIIKTCIKTAQSDELNFDMAFWKVIANGFVIAITVIVVAVPEGLPLAVTISLAFSVAEMQKEKNLVRKLSSSETMGNANEICTDKTGTLTANKMHIARAFIQYTDYDKMDKDTFAGLESSQLIVDNVVMNTTAFYEMKDGEERGTGNSTELGMLNYLRDCGAEVLQGIKERESKMANNMYKIPLNSERKRSTIAFMKGADMVRIYCKGGPEIVLKLCSNYIGEGGAVYELTEENRTHIIKDIQDSYAQITLRTLIVAYRDVSLDEFNEMKNSEDAAEQIESNLTVVMMFGLKDPLREGIAQAVASCHKAGINVRMITGDALATAKAISVEAGILTQADLDEIERDEADFVKPTDKESFETATMIAMEGVNFRNQIGGRIKKIKTPKKKEVNSDGEESDGADKFEIKVVAEIDDMHKFKKIKDKLKVMARSAPDDKFMLVDGLIRCGQTVAVTGDGTNDAPALNRSDVGFAMGITGTDVAKSACDITLLDDNFCSILTAVRYGRNIYDNIRKFLQFQLTVNVVAMFIVFAGACIFNEPPLTSTQMLWVNLIMDTFAALALATEPPHADIRGLPAKKSDMIVNEVMWRNIILQSVFQITWLLLLLFKGKDWFNIHYDDVDPLYPDFDQAKDHNKALDPLDTVWVENEPTNKVHMYSIIFQSFVFLQLFNQINSRKLGENEWNMFAQFFNNWMFIVITLFTFGIQVLIVQYAGRFMSVTPITWEQNAWCLAIGFSCMPFSVLTKLVPGRWFAWIKLEEREKSADEAESGFMGTVRRQSTMARSKTNLSSRKKQQQKVETTKDDDKYSNDSFKEDINN